MPKLKDYPKPEIITQKKLKLTATEQAQVDQFLEKYGFIKNQDQ